MFGALGLTALIYLDATPAQMGLLAAAATMPVLIARLPAGVCVARLPRRSLLIVADAGRALLLLSVPAAALLGGLAMAQLYVVQALASTLTLVFVLAYRSYLPSLVEREQLVEGNS